MARTRKPLNVVALNKKATEYTTGILTNVDFGLGALDKEAFEKAMEAIFGAVGSSYVRGFMDGREES